MAEWRDITDYEGRYQVSDEGEVRSIDRSDGRNRRRGQLRRFDIDRYGYAHVGLSKGGRSKRYTVHSLVLKAFVGPCPFGMEACHGDGDKRNNRLTNLRWDTHSNNELDKQDRFGRRPGAKLTPEQVEQIKVKLKVGIQGKALAKAFNVSRSAISRIKVGKAWVNSE